MSYANRRQMSSNRTVAIVIVALLHVLLGYALVTGLAYNVVKQAAEDLKTFDVEDEPPPPPEEPPPPPENVPETPPPVVSPPPLVRTNTVAPQIQVVRDAPPPVVTYVAPPIVARPAPPPPPPPPPPTVVQSARAKGSLPGLFSTDDYPQDALRNEQQGTTAVRLTIGTDGRVSDCSVTSSSGSSSLDTATCRIIRQRARYTPARGSNGSAATDTDNARIRWVVPED